ncbi:hypothetical protein SDC9_61329 [bioreactor metagenome]|uniref:Uncharacterized protein n=1 Tax=bioreactor metagenome TaxID=1076179 RepID=A0A644XFI1_9ZZZZ
MTLGERYKSVAEFIVRHGVEFVTPEPCVCVVPDFADDQDIRVRLLQLTPQFAPERMGNFVRNIQPPAVQIQPRCPVERGVGQVLYYVRIGRIKPRHGRHRARKRIVVAGFGGNGEAVEVEPLGVRRARAVCQNILKQRVFVAAVVKNGVENHL